jgi:glucosamine 6-phosphate synthetase-like amidotransferase/phosphosugar isomerase protein
MTIEEHPLMTDILALAKPETWKTSLDVSQASAAQWLHHQATQRFSKIYLVGCGTSYYAGMVGKSLIEHIAHIPAEAFPAYDFYRYSEPTLLGPGTLVVGITTTGNTESVNLAVERARACGATTLGITADEATRIGRIAQGVVRTGAKVTISVKTNTYVLSLVALFSLALELAEQNGVGTSQQRAGWVQQIEAAGRASQRFLETQRGEIEALADQFAPVANNAFILASGPNLGTGEEACLKVIEMAKMFSETQELENFLHGRFREVDQANPMFFIAPAGPAYERLLDFLTATQHVGAPSIVLTDQPTPELRRLASTVIQMPGGLDEFTTPLLYVLPFYLFGYEMAIRRGFDPAARRYKDIVPQGIRFTDPGAGRLRPDQKYV